MNLPDWIRMKWDLADDPTVSTWMRTGARALGRGIPAEQEVKDARRLLEVAEARLAQARLDRRESYSGGTRDIDLVAARTDTIPTTEFGKGLIPEEHYLGVAKVVTNPANTYAAQETVVRLPGGSEIKHHRGGW